MNSCGTDTEMRIHDLLEGRLDAPRIRELEDQLRIDPEARSLYHAHTKLHGAMLYRATGFDPAQIVPMDRVIARNQRRQFRNAILASAAVLMLGLLVLSLVLSRDNPPMLSVQVSQGSEFTITHAPGDEPPTDKLVLEPGSRLKLLRGTVELDFGSGVRGIVRAPADLSLLDERRLQLSRGIGWFEVPPEASGFQVITPTVTLTDLGTEFGICSQPDRADEVHVFEGSVEVVNQQGVSQQQPMEAGQAARADPTGDWKPVELNRTYFLDQLPESEADPFVRAVFHDRFSSDSSAAYRCMEYLHGRPHPDGFKAGSGTPGILELDAGNEAMVGHSQVVLLDPELRAGQTYRADFLTGCHGRQAVGMVLTDDPSGQRYKLRCRIVGGNYSIDFARGAKGEVLWRNRSAFTAPDTFWIERPAPQRLVWYRGISVDQRDVVAEITLVEDPGSLHVGVQAFATSAHFDNLAILNEVDPSEKSARPTNESK